MITVSAKSWHYRFIKWANRRHPSSISSLCGYFWALVFAFVKVVVFSVPVILVSICLGGAALETFFGIPMKTLTGLQWLYVFGAGVVSMAAIVLVAFGVGFGIVALVSFIQDAYQTKKAKWYAKDYEAKRNGTYHPNVFVEYFKARKEKVCPTIKFKE